LRLAAEGKLISFWREDTGEKLLIPEELVQALQNSEEEAKQERQRAEQEPQRAEQAEQSLQQAIPRLLGLGLSVKQVSETLGLSIEQVQAQAPNH
jgi:DNA-binding NarL/FixJ family response regulator